MGTKPQEMDRAKVFRPHNCPNLVCCLLNLKKLKPPKKALSGFFCVVLTEIVSSVNTQHFCTMRANEIKGRSNMKSKIESR